MMARHSVEVHQLGSFDAHAYLNVDEKKFSGAVTVWGSCDGQSVYLFQRKQIFYLMVFPNEDWAEDFFDDPKNEEWLKSFKATRIEPLE